MRFRQRGSLSRIALVMTLASMTGSLCAQTSQPAPGAIAPAQAYSTYDPAVTPANYPALPATAIAPSATIFVGQQNRAASPQTGGQPPGTPEYYSPSIDDSQLPAFIGASDVVASSSAPNPAVNQPPPPLGSTPAASTPRQRPSFPRTSSGQPLTGAVVRVRPLAPAASAPVLLSADPGVIVRLPPVDSPPSAAPNVAANSGPPQPGAPVGRAFWLAPSAAPAGARGFDAATAAVLSPLPPAPEPAGSMLSPVPIGVRGAATELGAGAGSGEFAPPFVPNASVAPQLLPSAGQLPPANPQSSERLVGGAGGQYPSTNAPPTPTRQGRPFWNSPPSSQPGAGNGVDQSRLARGGADPPGTAASANSRLATPPGAGSPLPLDADNANAMELSQSPANPPSARRRGYGGVARKPASASKSAPQTTSPATADAASASFGAPASAPSGSSASAPANPPPAAAPRGYGGVDRSAVPGARAAAPSQSLGYGMRQIQYQPETIATPPPMMTEGISMAPLPEPLGLGATAPTLSPAASDPSWAPQEVEAPAAPAFDDQLFRVPLGVRLSNWWHQSVGKEGLGHERVMLAPFEIEVTQPFNNYRFRYDSYYDQQNPDKAEFFWARSGSTGGKGPYAPDTNVNWQQMQFYAEFASEKASMALAVPINMIDPVVAKNTAGIGDIYANIKYVILDGYHWQATAFFRPTFDSGSASRGLGTGHITLEPGILARWKWTPETFIHMEARYWIPIAGDPMYAGSVFRFSLGMSHLLYESDRFAVIPTCEIVNWKIENGLYTSYPTGVATSAEAQYISNALIGLRMPWDHDGDLGLCELGICGGLAMTDPYWYHGLARAEFRWSF